jgi:hypothetical protein
MTFVQVTASFIDGFLEIDIFYLFQAEKFLFLQTTWNKTSRDFPIQVYHLFSLTVL